MTVDDRFQPVLGTVADRLQDDIAHHMRKLVDELVNAARGEVEAADLDWNQRLVEGVRSLDRAGSLSEILDTLASCAGREASRTAVLLVTGARYRGWRFIGFDASFDVADGVEFGANDARVIAEAVGTNSMTSGDEAGPRRAPLFAALPPGRASLAMPISLCGQAVAVLYADEGMNQEGPIPVANRLEVLARHAAARLEAITALNLARMSIELPRRLKNQIAPSPSADDAYSDGGVAAQRYARFLMSEIKLYHEEEVLAGQRDHDLATRLDGVIARARVLYEQRVPPDVRERTDYFHTELVRTLANGDESLLELRASTVRTDSTKADVTSTW